jgi:Uma2 family endonuclease
MSALPIHKMTMEEYLEFDKNAEGRYEYFDGEVFAMAGGSPEHARIGVNVTTRLFMRLLGSKCEVFNSTCISKFLPRCRIGIPMLLLCVASRSLKNCKASKCS